MKRPRRILHLIPVAIVALLLGPATPATHVRAAPPETPFSVADLFFELNNTDGDLGLHANIDGEAWKVLEIEGPNDSLKLRITASSTLRQQGLTQLFFESAEPPFDELPPSQFFARFPEGTWDISGIALDGSELESTDKLRHVLAAPPENVTVSDVAAAESCDVDPLPSVSEPVVIRWDPVTSSHPTIGNTGPIKVVKYQLIVEREEPTQLILSLDLPPDVTEFEIPEGFIALGDAFKFEILVREATGNQTAIESCFEIE